MPRGREPRATRRDDRSQARQHRSCPWGPQPPQPHTRLFPAARLSDRGPRRQGRLTAPASPAGLRPVLDPPGPLTQDRQLSGNRADHGPRPHLHQARGPVRHAATAGNTGKRPVKPRLTRPRSFRDDTEVVTGSNPVRPTIFSKSCLVLKARMRASDLRLCPVNRCPGRRLASCARDVRQLGVGLVHRPLRRCDARKIRFEMVACGHSGSDAVLVGDRVRPGCLRPGAKILMPSARNTASNELVN